MAKQQQGKFECERCGQTFQSKAEMEEHAKTCTASGRQGSQVSSAGGQTRE
jgi:hypothetical protein